MRELVRYAKRNFIHAKLSSSMDYREGMKRTLPQADRRLSYCEPSPAGLIRVAAASREPMYWNARPDPRTQLSHKRADTRGIRPGDAARSKYQ